MGPRAPVQMRQTRFNATAKRDFGILTCMICQADIGCYLYQSLSELMHQLRCTASTLPGQSLSVGSISMQLCMPKRYDTRTCFHVASSQCDLETMKAITLEREFVLRKVGLHAMPASAR